MPNLSHARGCLALATGGANPSGSCRLLARPARSGAAAGALAGTLALQEGSHPWRLNPAVDGKAVGCWPLLDAIQAGRPQSG